MILRALPFALCLCTPALAAPLEVVVDRSERGIELFLSLPASAAQSVLGADLSLLEGLSTGVDYTVLQNGTWTQGDALWRGARTWIDDQPVTFEAMSMMVHPKDDILPFADPIEALTAISVCGVAVPDQPPSLNDMHLYVGYIAYPATGTGTLRLDLGNIGAVEVTVRDFNGDFAQTSRLTLAPGQALTLPAPAPSATPWLWALVAISLCASVMLAALLWRQTKNAPAHGQGV